MASRPRILALMLLGAVLAVAAIAAAHVYLVQRMVFDAGLGSPWREAAVAGVAGGFALLFAQPLAERMLPPRHARFVAWPAALWMGLSFGLFVVLGASEVVLALGNGVAFAAGVAGPEEADGLRTGALRAASAALVVLGAGAAALRSGLGGPRDVRIEVELPRWPRALDGYRIVQISDIHIGAILDRRFARSIAARVNALDADLVAVTGDLVDGSARHLRAEVEPLAALRARDGVFFVPGNHDFYSGVEAWTTVAAGLGWQVLRNEHRWVAPARARAGDANAVDAPGGAAASSRAPGFVLAGVDDYRSARLPGPGGEDLDAALEGLPRGEDEPALLLLAHDPCTFDRAHARGVDLQLSGHTHGGQIWPFHYLVRAAVPYLAGRYRRGDAQLYVSRGTGFWGPPMRLGAPAEITEIVLRAPSGAAAAAPPARGLAA